MAVGVNVCVGVCVAVGDGKYLSDNESWSGLNQIKAMNRNMHTPNDAAPRKDKAKRRLVGFSCSLGFKLRGHLP